MKRKRSVSEANVDIPTAKGDVVEGVKSKSPPTKSDSDAAPQRYWLLKSEPVEFGMSHLESAADKRGRYDGVRAVPPMKSMRDDMRPGDLAFFYHSGITTPAIAGIVHVITRGFVDALQFDPTSKYFDAKVTKDEPKWYAVDIELVRRLSKPITLATLKNHSGPGGALADLRMLKIGRLSVSPVSEAEWNFILTLEEK